MVLPMKKDKVRTRRYNFRKEGDQNNPTEDKGGIRFNRELNRWRDTMNLSKKYKLFYNCF
jgi:hypothetical protein